MTHFPYQHLVPRDVTTNLLMRRRVLAECDRDPAARAAVKAACAADCLFFVNLFGWQFNPKKPPAEAVGPFCTYPYQDEAVGVILAAAGDEEDLVIEKSRTMGATWLCLFVSVWDFLFHDWRKDLLFSRKEEMVKDRSDSDSLFWKIDFILDRLPGWLMPAGWSDRLHKNKSGYENPELGSSITGTSTTGDAGVGGRAGRMFLDEFARVRDGFDVVQGTAAVAVSRIFNSTHTGSGTAFFKLCYDPISSARKLRMHWTQHPEYNRGLYRYDPAQDKVVLLDGWSGTVTADGVPYRYPEEYQFVRAELPAGGFAPGVRSPYYDKECRKLLNDPRKIAVELDIDALGSQRQFFPGLLLAALVRKARKPAWRGDVHYDRDTGRPVGLVEVENGPLKIWCPLDGNLRPPPRHYGFGGDISAGSGATPSCLAFWDEFGDMVAEYETATVEPKDFAPVATALGWWFAGPGGEAARFAWEIPGPGLTFGVRVLEIGYPNVFMRAADPLEKIKGKKAPKAGWANTRQTFLAVMEEYRYALSQGLARNPSEAGVKSLGDVVYTEGGAENVAKEVSDDPSGASVHHGDLGTAGAIGWMVVRQRVRPPEAKEPAAAPHPSSLAVRREMADNAAARSEDITWE